MSKISSIRRSLVVATVVTASAVVAGVAGAQSSNTCNTVAPSPIALKKALGTAAQSPIATTGPPTYCDVSGSGLTGARIYLYSKSMAKTVEGQMAQAFSPHTPTKQSLSGLGSGATLEYLKGTDLVYFTAGSRFILVSGKSITHAQIVAVARAVYAKLG
jgi:hypothetical protein